MEDIKEIQRVLNLSYINAVDKEKADKSLKQLQSKLTNLKALVEEKIRECEKNIYEYKKDNILEQVSLWENSKTCYQEILKEIGEIND